MLRRVGHQSDNLTRRAAEIPRRAGHPHAVFTCSYKSIRAATMARHVSRSRAGGTSSARPPSRWSAALAESWHRRRCVPVVEFRHCGGWVAAASADCPAPLQKKSARIKVFFKPPSSLCGSLTYIELRTGELVSASYCQGEYRTAFKGRSHELRETDGGQLPTYRRP
jgi:hypothetical protein